MTGELASDRVIVREQSEANRLYNKGHYGRPQSGGALHLTLLEAAYLVEAERLHVTNGAGVLSWHDLVVHAVNAEPEFEIHYLVYRDLRGRGYLVQAAPPSEARSGAQFRVWPRESQPRPGDPTMWVRAASERAPFHLAHLLRLAADAQVAKARAVVALVDEESDLTYYQLDRQAPGGQVAPQKTPARPASLLGDRVLTSDPQAVRDLHAREFFGHPVASGLQLSLVEAIYLVEEGRLEVRDAPGGKPLKAAALRKQARAVEPEIELRLRAFKDLKARGLIVKTGFKFGTHFRAYETRPEEGHAPYLVQAVPREFSTEWAPVARAIRLSHSVRKKFYFAAVGGAKPEYLAFGRFRP